jgi:hypothetical protein
MHVLEVGAEDVSLSLMSRNVPSASNPKISRIVAPSVRAALRGRLTSIDTAP